MLTETTCPMVNISQLELDITVAVLELKERVSSESGIC